MYRVKAKNKDTGQTVLVWESYSKDDKAFLLYSDIELENKLAMEKYEVIEEPSEEVTETQNVEEVNTTEEQSSQTNVNK